MSIDVQKETGKEDKPLTRADVERYLREAGSPDKLDLSGRTFLEGIDLTNFILSGANLSEVDLRRANLSRADLSRAILEKANLVGANLMDTALVEANLSGANLSGANLSRANLAAANLMDATLTRADLSKVNLRGATLTRADLSEATLRDADLSRTTLSGADLSRADLSGTMLSEVKVSDADLREAILTWAKQEHALLSESIIIDVKLSDADLHEATLIKTIMHEVQLRGADWHETVMPQDEKEQPRATGAISLGEFVQTAEPASKLRVRIIEEPLTAHNLAAAISVLAELYTKCWLIARGRLGDLIEYTQTHDIRFVEEADLVITKLNYNSPAEMELTQGKSADTKSKSDFPVNVDVKVEATPEAVMKALGTAIDGVVQAPLRFKEKQLEIQTKAQEIRRAEQKATQESQMALLEKEKRDLENERQRLELIEKRLEVQKKGIEYALEIASKVVDVLYPTADTEARAMITRTLLPNILQLGDVKGLELTLPTPQSGDYDLLAGYGREL